ncbi:class I SAM-dependent methyltransferase [Cellulophaga sp. Hel_I_12]|uniref:class I SAM-dependent methyltransferase n=1 Tax=Cellulophaga sp. Hel_I_12 TaxID=1249972 RepID=UPI000A94B019|nr:class I SAM-dependent methyltransferase [Cellulophaga sp. Hel_I_12]
MKLGDKNDRLKLSTKQAFLVLMISTLMLPLQSCKSQQKETPASESSEIYTYKRNDPNGIGKWYQGREIAHVMGFQGMEWLNRPEREQEESVSRLLKNLDLQATDVIADIGAGSGYHVFKMAPVTQEGAIYAVDIQEEMLAEMSYQKERNSIANVYLVKGSEQDVNLPENSIDKVLMVDVYHEFEYPLEMLLAIKKALKPEGKIFLIEYRGEDPNIPIKIIHKMTEAQAVKEFKTAGFTLLENKDNLPWQHCMVFELKSE